MSLHADLGFTIDTFINSRNYCNMDINWISSPCQRERHPLIKMEIFVLQV